MSTTHVLPPKARARIAAIGDQEAAQTIFDTTSGKVDIAFILVSPLQQVAAATPLVVSFRHPSDSPVYLTVGVGGNSSTVVIPGFELPAGGLEVIVTGGTGSNTLDIDVFYFTSNQL